MPPLSAEALNAGDPFQALRFTRAGAFSRSWTSGLIEIERQRSEMIGFPQDVQVPSSQSLSSGL
jgi:hypothetical protein